MKLQIIQHFRKILKVFEKEYNYFFNYCNVINIYLINKHNTLLCIIILY